MCVMLLPMFFMTSASAGGSNVYLVSSSSVGNGQINTGDFLISGGVHAEGDSIVFDEQVSENAYIKTRSRINNMSDYGITRLFSAEFTLVVNDIAEEGSISFAFGLDSISNNAGAADSMELAVTYDGYLNFSVLKYTEAETPEVVKSARFGNLNYLDEVSIKIEADYRNRLTVYIHDLETPFIYQKATDTDLAGYMAFSQTEQNDFAVSAATVIGYRYETAENPDYVETFDNGEYNSNMFYSRALTSSFEGSSLSVDNLKLISNTFPDLNIIWVVTERGDMLSSEHIGHSQNGTSNNINNSPININQNKDAEIEQLKRDVDYLTELLKAKDEIIKLLKTKN